MCVAAAQSASCCPPRTRNPQPPPRGMREPLVSGSREAGGVRGVARQRASAVVGVRVGERVRFIDRALVKLGTNLPAVKRSLQRVI